MSAPIGNSAENVVVAVKKVADYLRKGNKVIDDTVIHSLFDSIKLNFDSVDCIEKVELQTFVEDVASHCTELDSCTVVFALEVTGWIARNDVYYTHFKSSIHRVFHTIWMKLKSKDLCDVSVTVALYDSLSLLAKHKEGLQWIVRDKEITGVMIEGLSLLRASPISIFLEKAVTKYLSVVIVELEKLEEGTTCNVFSSKILNSAVENIKNHYCRKHVGPFVPGSLQLLENICRQSPGTSKQLLTEHAEFCKYLLDMIGLLNSRDCDAVLNIINAVLQVGAENDSCSIKGDFMEAFCQKIEDQLLYLTGDGNIPAAQKLARCCLKSHGRARLEQTCKDVLTQPVNWILETDVQCSVIPEQVLQKAISTRCKCTDIVCRSLDGNTIGASATADLLRGTIIFSGHGGKPCSEAASYLYKNRKIQRKCLETLITAAQQKKDEGFGSVTRVQTIVEIFKEPDSETVIYSLCSHLLLVWLPLLFTDKDAVSLTMVLGETIQYHLSALQWELRDTTLELLGKIIERYKDNSSVRKWMVEYGLHVQVWQCVKDGESYVRASAITAMCQLCLCPNLLTELVKSGQVTNEADIMETIFGIVENDSEAFARRSAMLFLLKFFKVKVSSKVKVASDVKDSSNGIPDDVIEAIVTATRDFDWEVKLLALDFVSFIIQTELLQSSKSVGVSSEVPEYAKNIYGSKLADTRGIRVDLGHLVDVLSRKKIVDVLIDALDDYDEKVCEKAYKIFADLQTSLRAIVDNCEIEAENKRHFEKTHSEHSDMTDVNVMVPENENAESAVIGQCGTKRRKLNDGDSSLKLQEETDNTETNLANLEHLNGANGVTKTKLDKSDENTMMENACIFKILDFDLSVYKSILDLVNDEAAKLVSLVEDIITVANNEDDENAVDCY